MEGENENNGKRVCVTGGTGFVASSLIFKLLQTGYSVNTTLRSFPGLYSISIPLHTLFYKINRRLKLSEGAKSSSFSSFFFLKSF